MTDRSHSRSRDPNQLAKLIVDIATGEVVEPEHVPPPPKNPAAVELGRKGGLKGGAARAKKLSQAERSEIAQNAAATRWERQKQDRKEG